MFDVEYVDVLQQLELLFSLFSSHLVMHFSAHDRFRNSFENLLCVLEESFDPVFSIVWTFFVLLVHLLAEVVQNVLEILDFFKRVLRWLNQAGVVTNVLGEYFEVLVGETVTDIGKALRWSHRHLGSFFRFFLFLWSWLDLWTVVNLFFDLFDINFIILVLNIVIISVNNWFFFVNNLIHILRFRLLFFDLFDDLLLFLIFLVLILNFLFILDFWFTDF